MSQYNSMQSACSPKCAIELTKLKAKKEFNRETKELKEKAKTRGDWLKEAQTAFNRFIRLRDHNLGCISCGTKKDVQYAAGHYKTVGGHAELRFCLINVHKQCNKNCNQSKSGNIMEYRIRLIDKIKIESVEWLEGHHEIKKYTIDEIKEIKTGFRQWGNELERDIKLNLTEN